MFRFHCYYDENDIEKRREMWIDVNEENIPPGNPDLTCAQITKFVKYGISWLLEKDFDPILEVTLGECPESPQQRVAG
jgi:hypothetical protein